MPQMTPGQARVIDPIQTNLARGYRNAAFIGSALFPIVPVGQRGGKVLEFGREDFMLYDTARAPGTNTKRVQFGYFGSPYALEQHALEGVVPFENMDDARVVPGINQGRIAIRKIQSIIGLKAEKAQADLATNAANYPATNKAALSGTSQWSDHDNSNPSTDIEYAKEVVRGQIGMAANTVVLGAKVFSKIKQHPKLIDRIKYTSRDVITTDLLAALWEVDRVIVGKAVYAENGAMIDIWGNFVVLAYTNISDLSSFGEPSYGYTYQLENYPIVEQVYQSRSAKSWVYPVTDEISPVIAGASAGFLFSTVIA